MGAPASTEKQLERLTDPVTGALRTTAVGGSGGGGGGATTIADGADVTQGAKLDAAYVSGAGTVVSILKGTYVLLDSGLAVPGSDTTGMNAMLVGAMDTNSPQQIQGLQLDGLLNLLMSLGTQIDAINDWINAIQSHGYPNQQKCLYNGTGATGTTITIPLAPSVSPSITPLAPQFGLGGMPNIAPIRWGRFTISNATNKTLTGFTITFSGTVDSVAQAFTYTYPFALTQAAGAIATYWMPFPEAQGVFNTASMVTTHTATLGSGYVQVQCLWGFSPITAYPKEWQFDTSVNSQVNTSVDIIVAPPSGTRLVLEEAIFVNSHVSQGTDVTLTEGSGGATRGKGFCGIAGLGWKKGPYHLGLGAKWPTATAISFIAATAANINGNAKGHYEPI